MNLSVTMLVKLWITVALCFGALSDALDAGVTSSPPEVKGDPRSSPVADYSRLYNGLFFPHDDDSLSAEAKDGLHGPGDDDDDDENSFYMDQGPPQEDGLTVEADQSKRSMGMLRLGRRIPSLDKRPRSSMAGLRLGRRSPAFETGNDKRSMGMLRLGRRAPSAVGDFEGEGEEERKRSMGMLRLGRSQGLRRRRASLGR